MPSTEVTFWTPVSKVWGQHGPARSRKTPMIERIDTSKKTCRIIEKLKLQGQRRRGRGGALGKPRRPAGRGVMGALRGGRGLRRHRRAYPTSSRSNPICEAIGVSEG